MSERVTKNDNEGLDRHHDAALRAALNGGLILHTSIHTETGVVCETLVDQLGKLCTRPLGLGLTGVQRDDTRLATYAAARVAPGQVWRHYKGNLYVVLCQTPFFEKDFGLCRALVVTYLSLKDGRIWSRPSVMWHETVRYESSRGPIWAPRFFEVAR